MNLDSLSLYTRAGFVPSRVYQDLSWPCRKGLRRAGPAAIEHVRNATPDDVEAMAALELDVSGISRAKDYRYFIENARRLLACMSVIEDGRGGLDGYLASIGHPLFNEIGPGVARDEEAGAALLLDHLNHYPGSTPLVLVPTECRGARSARSTASAGGTARCTPLRRAARPSHSAASASPPSCPRPASRTGADARHRRHRLPGASPRAAAPCSRRPGACVRPSRDRRVGDRAAWRRGRSGRPPRSRGRAPRGGRMRPSLPSRRPARVRAPRPRPSACRERRGSPCRARRCPSRAPGSCTFPASRPLAPLSGLSSRRTRVTRTRRGLTATCTR